MRTTGILAGLIGMGLVSPAAATEGPVARWSFETLDQGTAADDCGTHPGRLHGSPEAAPGVRGRSLRLDGVRDFVRIPDAPELRFADATFSVAAWVNIYAVDRGQQMVVGKNVYSANQREWSLLVDNDRRFRFYLRHEGWKTVASRTVPTPGRWHHVAVAIQKGHARLYVDGVLEGEADLGPSLAPTPAPVTIGGIDDGGRPMQMLHGALDCVALYSRALTPEEILAMAKIETTPHDLPEPPAPFPLWAGGPIPGTRDLPVLRNVEFHVIKPYRFAEDGYRFHHGVALAWHKDRLHASIGMNRNGENMAGEQALWLVSEDGGRTWGDLRPLGKEPGGAVSHGVFLSCGGELWAFHGAFGKDMGDGMHTRIYQLDEAAAAWRLRGTLLPGFWPLQEPQRLADGNWLMAGARIGAGNPAAVAISRGDDLERWDLVVVPKAPGEMWGESAVLVAGARVLNLARYHANSRLVALAARSEDHGRTWTASEPSDLPMAATKPYAGTLANGQNYLISTTTGDSGNRRSPLTIALTRPGEWVFSRILVIRHADLPGGPGESHPSAALSYPYAVEHKGKLYVGYSNSGGGVGRVGEGRQRWNNNSIELAVIPLESLAGTEDEKPARGPRATRE